MKSNKQLMRNLFMLFLVGCFAGGVYLSVYFRDKPDKGIRGATHARSEIHFVTSLSSAAATGTNETRRIAALTKTMRRARDIGLGMNSPMEFYGHVIDQFGKPVQGVNAQIHYVYYDTIVLATYEPHKADEKRVTDINGDFSFTGKEGVSLFITLQPDNSLKFGKGGQWSHVFQNAKQSGAMMQPTSKDRPFVFYAYRLGQPAEVKEESMHAFLIADKRPYQVILSENKITEEGAGDFIVSVWQKGVLGKSPSSWGISVQGANNLQFQLTDDPFLYWAPREGYQSSWDFSWADDAKNYGDARDFKFWIKQREGYGSLSVECAAFFKNKFRLIVRSSVNQKPGDQNLQPILPNWPPKDTPVKK